VAALGNGVPRLTRFAIERHETYDSHFLASIRGASWAGRSDRLPADSVSGAKPANMPSPADKPSAEILSVVLVIGLG
jgi:hypothetical protein